MFLSLHKFLCPTFNAEEHVMFHLSLNTTNRLLILDSLGGNIRSARANQIDGSIQMFDLLHYDN